ncbi:MAG: TlpA family protein disulfide reductase [Puniceicoccaceae bacterium]
MFKRISFILILFSAFLLPLGAETEPASDGDTTAPENAAPARELKAAMQTILSMYRSGETDAVEYAKYLNELDTLYDKIDAGMQQERFSVLIFKGMVYQNILDDLPAARQEYERILSDFTDTELIAKVEKLVAQIDMLESLQVGGVFPDLSFSDLEGKAISLADYKGKVVLIDFWATWCPPCIAELPHLLETYQEFNDSGFEIIGISLDKDKEKLESFIAENKMDWPQYYDGKGWDNELSNKYAVSSIPTTYLIGPEGKIIAKDLRGDDLEKAVSQAVEAL